MKIIHYFDEDNFYDRPALWDDDEPIPENATLIGPPSSDEAPYYEKYGVGFIKLFFNNLENKWEEHGTLDEALALQQEFADAKNQTPKSDKKKISELTMNMALKDLQIKNLQQQQATAAMQLASVTITNKELQTKLDAIEKKIAAL